MKKSSFKLLTYEEALLKVRNKPYGTVIQGTYVNRPRRAKKAPLRKVKAKSISKLKKELWKWFSLYIRRRDKNVCFICSRVCSGGSDYHASHFVPKSVGGLALYFHEDNVHGCCYNCNINLGGNYYLYGKRLGTEKSEELYKMKQLTTKWTAQDYLDNIQKYQMKSQLDV